MTIQQPDLYYQRMTAALGDKKLMLQYLRPGKVLDVGCGNGILLDALAAMGHTPYGLDATEESVHRSHEHEIQHDVRLGYAQDTAEIFGENFFDTILCSSVLHEVYSYGDPVRGTLSYEAVQAALDSFKRALKPGGRLIIRDGVEPEYGGLQRISFAPDEVAEGMRLAEKYLTMIPFRGLGERQVDLTRIADGWLEGDARSVMEFLYTYTWGEGSFERETQELYGVYTLPEYEDVLAESGFTLVDGYSYLQRGYELNLQHRAVVTDIHNVVLPYPESNMLLVAEKR